jgi:hypothetical protein
MSPLFRLQGLTPAIDDLKKVLAQAFVAEPDLASVLSTEGMLNVRMRKPTDGSVSTHISNHAWGTAVDFKISGFDAPANTGPTVPRFIAILIPLLNDVGWFSGVGFHDTMHFEVSEERIREWTNKHVFKGGPVQGDRSRIAMRLAQKPIAISNTSLALGTKDWPRGLFMAQRTISLPCSDRVALGAKAHIGFATSD